ncbi:MAG: prepilin-type N-terminal cleavage/methylation domain-containing protein [Candidatus Paceibacteria bacterium]|jgi:prepilin-type N-terminal cleavage/methylation domain-containing protein
MNMNIRNLRIGFTLIELLVVISIVGILSSVIYVGFSDARHSAQNKSITSELKTVQLVLEVYKAQDADGQYPNALADLTPEFIAKLPSDSESSNPACSIVYETDAGRTWYKLTAEKCFAGATAAADGIQPDEAVARCPSYCGDCDGVAYGTYVASDDFYESMAVYSAGGECE